MHPAKAEQHIFHVIWDSNATAFDIASAKPENVRQLSYVKQLKK